MSRATRRANRAQSIRANNMKNKREAGKEQFYSESRKKAETERLLSKFKPMVSR